MLESQLINSWINRGAIQGKVKGGRENLLTVLCACLSEPVPEKVRLAIEGTDDPDTLSRWLLAALRARTWQEFQAAMPADG